MIHPKHITKLMVKLCMKPLLRALEDWQLGLDSYPEVREFYRHIEEEAKPMHGRKVTILAMRDVKRFSQAFRGARRLARRLVRDHHSLNQLAALIEGTDWRSNKVFVEITQREEKP